jgi:hypothetical protein
MRRALSDSISLAALGAVVLGIVIAVSPGRRSLAVDVYVLVVGALALLAVGRIARAAQSAEPSPFDEALRPASPSAERPNELTRLEREIALASARAFDLHHRLRPTLREIADHRLATRRGLALDSGSSAVRAALGDELWELLAPDRPRPRRHHDPGVPLETVRDAVERLEAI